MVCTSVSCRHQAMRLSIYRSMDITCITANVLVAFPFLLSVLKITESAQKLLVKQSRQLLTGPINLCVVGALCCVP
jgi:hypothetical protein